MPRVSAGGDFGDPSQMSLYEDRFLVPVSVLDLYSMVKESSIASHLKKSLQSFTKYQTVMNKTQTRQDH